MNKGQCGSSFANIRKGGLESMSKLHKKTNEMGFSLVELLVVVVIIGVLVAIAVPVYSNITTQANRKTVEANLRIIDSAIEQYKGINEKAIPNKDDLNSYLQSWPTGPDGVEYDVSNEGRAVISRGSTGDWFTTEDVSLPITW